MLLNLQIKHYYIFKQPFETNVLKILNYPLKKYINVTYA